MAGISITFPIQDDIPRGTLFRYDYSSKQSIKSRLILLLSTQKGERFMFPEYGTNLRKYLFEPNDDIAKSQLEAEVKQSISKFFPSISILKFDAQNQDKDAILFIEFGYTENSLRYSDSITMRFSNAA